MPRNSYLVGWMTGRGEEQGFIREYQGIIGNNLLSVISMT
jgi:hypothetical protein